jgi:hypothetical protein
MGNNIVIGMVVLGMYFVPTIVGWKKKNSGSIMMLNLFLGWTLIGWVIALCWALAVEDDEIEDAASEPTLCTSCGKYSAGHPKFCASCGAQIAGGAA